MTTDGFISFYRISQCFNIFVFKNLGSVTLVVNIFLSLFWHKLHKRKLEDNLISL